MNASNNAAKLKKSGFVALAGRPNVGKSTLLNELLGSRLSIVTPKAQTTRERVLGILTEKKHGQIVFVDTPGIHRARSGGINASMVNEARLALESAQAIWYLVDPLSAIAHEEVVLQLIAQAPKDVPVFVILNKADLKLSMTPRVEDLLKDLVKRLEAAGYPVAVNSPWRVSAMKGRGIEPLLEATWALLPEGAPYYPDPEQISDRPMRFFVGEKIREQLYLQLGEELPYSCAVEIEKFEEKAGEMPRIEAVIHVERESQKGMVVGKGGQKIRSIGLEARKEVEKFLGQQIFLGLKVSLLKEWSRDADTLKRLGYFLPEG